jgi:hypothetical protein
LGLNSGYRSYDIRPFLIVAILAAGSSGCSGRGASRIASTSKAEFTGGQSSGNSPVTDIEPVDLFEVYNLPHLRDARYGPLGGALVHLQITKRAKDLDLIGKSAIRAWESVPALAGLADELEIHATQETEFRGSKSSELNALLTGGGARSVRVLSAALEIDQPLRIAGSGIRLDLGNAVLRGSTTLQYLVRIENANGIDLRGGRFLGGDSGVLIHNSQRIRISGITIHGLGGAGIVISSSNAIAVRGGYISGLKYAGIILHRGVTGSVIEENRIEDGIGTPNLAAAILLTDREVDLAADSRAIYGPESYGVLQQPLATRRHPPSGNLIRANRLVRNQASGVYSDGGVKNVIASNLIAANAKEGICLDDASVANVVVANVVRRNGSRWGEPDVVLKMETIEPSGRLADGTPAAKVPGISLDNALYNVVFQNTVEDNYGGGIKLVRTSLFNLIGMNTLVANAVGSSEKFHYFGIELGAAPGDFTTRELDITPSRGNIVFSNMIRGPHYAGIYFGTDCDQNDVFDNVILGAAKWALESVTEMPNTTVNNLTNQPSRNVSAGLDPNLFVSARAVRDEHDSP